MLPSVASRVPVDRRPLRALRERLFVAFEIEFDLWWYDEGWRLVPPDAAGELEDATPEIAARLEPARVTGAEPMCVVGPDGATHLLIPLPKHQRRPFAA